MSFNIVGANLVPVDENLPESVNIVGGGNKSGDGVLAPLPSIGFGLPLTIDIRMVYTGNVGYHSILDGTGDIAVVSGVKDWGVFNASTRALNFIYQKTGKFAVLGTPSALTSGTPVVAYQKSVSSSQVTATVEIYSSGPDESSFTDIAHAFCAAAGVPLLMPYSGFLLAAGQILPFVGRLASAIYNKRASWSQTFNVNFGLPGTSASISEMRLISANPDEHEACTFSSEIGLICADGKPYRGNAAYVVVAIYGGVRPELDDFSPAVAGAAVMSQFDPSENKIPGMTPSIVETIRDVVDVGIRRQIEKLISQRDDASEKSDVDALNAKISALAANVEDKALLDGITE